MYFDDSRDGLTPATSDLGHVPWQGNPSLQTTVNPADLLLAQPSRGPTQSYGNPHNVASTGYNLVGYPPANHTYPGAPVRLPQSGMGHPSGQCFVIDDVPAEHFTGHLTPVVRMSRGHSFCQWTSEDQLVCGQLITETTVPKHLAEHGIQRMHKNHNVKCCWSGCGMNITRQSLTRHWREVHLGLKRKSHKYVFP